MDLVDCEEAECNAGIRLYRGLSSYGPTHEELIERIQLAEEYAVAAKRLLLEMAKAAGGK